MFFNSAKKINFFTIIFFASLVLFFTIFFITKTQAANDFPNTANYFLSWEMTSAEATELAKWDLIILDMEAQVKSLSKLQKIRKLNPDIIMLAYITPQEIVKNAQNSYSTMRQQLNAGLSDDWYLKDSKGNKLSWWPGTYIFNVTSEAPKKNGQKFQDYIVDFTVEEILSTGLWDGIFYDNAWDNITYFAGSDIDLDGDGKIDNNADKLWREGMDYIYEETRRLTDDKYFILGNNDSLAYLGKLNGQMLENVSSNNWEHMMNRAKEMRKHRDPAFVIMNYNTENTGKQSYQDMRFGITSSLLEDTYFSYDHGDQDHGQTWYYDEYNTNLGSAISDSYSNKNLNTYAPDIWRRDFSNGLSIVNSTGGKKTVQLNGEYEKIHGTQDKTINDGAIVSEVKVDGYDGLLLLKTFDGLNDVLFTNGDFARFVRPDGTRVRNGFFVFEEEYKGGAQVAHIDLDGNGKRDLVVVSKSKLMAWRDDGQLFMKKYPYTVNYKGKLRVAIGDVNRDRKMEIYVAPSVGYPAPIKVYTRHGRQMKKDWFPFGETYSGGYSMAVGKLTPGKWNQLAIGAGEGMDPIVSTYTWQYKKIGDWLAYEKSFRGGVNVAAGDVDGDGIDEIIAGAGPGKKPVVRIFDGEGSQLYDEFQVYSTFDNPGIEVRSLDVDFDGKDDILGMGGAF